jgi:hypothetical protein
VSRNDALRLFLIVFGASLQVCVVGSINYDQIVYVPKQLMPGQTVVSAKKNLSNNLIGLDALMERQRDAEYRRLIFSCMTPSTTIFITTIINIINIIIIIAIALSEGNASPHEGASFSSLHAILHRALCMLIHFWLLLRAARICLQDWLWRQGGEPVRNVRPHGRRCECAGPQILETGSFWSMLGIRFDWRSRCA